MAGSRALDVRDALVAALVAANLCASAVAVRHGVRGEPLGVGGSLDVHRPLVVLFWGTGLSAPLASLAFAVGLRRRAPSVHRALAVTYVAGALAEPVFWGRRPCPPAGKMLVRLHVATAACLALLGNARAGDTDVMMPGR